MKNQALFFRKIKVKKNKMSSVAILFGALKVKLFYYGCEMAHFQVEQLNHCLFYHFLFCPSY